MGWSLEAWRAVVKDRPDAEQLMELHPSHGGNPRLFRQITAAVEQAEKPRRSKSPDGMNKTERAFAETLDLHTGHDEIVRWWFEHLKLRIAGRTWYTPDFLVEVYAGLPVVCETKGFMEDDAAVKLKTAADKYPCFRWLLIRREGRHGWEVREVTRNGIGTSPIRVSWIHGS